MNLALSALTSLALGLGLSTALPRVNTNLTLNGTTNGSVDVRVPRLQTSIDAGADAQGGLRIGRLIKARLGGNTNAYTTIEGGANANANTSANTNAQAQTNASAETAASANAQTEANANVEGDVVLDVRLPRLSLDVSGDTETESDTFISIGL